MIKKQGDQLMDAAKGEEQKPAEGQKSEQPCMWSPPSLAPIPRLIHHFVDTLIAHSPDGQVTPV